MNNKTRNGIIAVVSIAILVIISKKFLTKSDSVQSNTNSQGGGNQGGGNQGGGNQGGGNQGGGNQGGGGKVQDLPLDYSGMADNLFDYMDGYGTNYKKIFVILESLRNKSDWYNLQSAYGVRKLSSGAGNIFVSDFNGNLKDALKDELNDSEYKKAQTILSAKGITF